MSCLLVKSIFTLLFASIVENSFNIQFCTSFRKYEEEAKTIFPSYIQNQKSGTSFIDTLYKNGETEVLEQFTKSYLKRLTLKDGFVQIFEVEKSTPEEAEGVLKQIFENNSFCSNEKGVNAKIGHHIGSDCLLQIESCLTNYKKYYFFGKKFQGDMKMPNMIELFKSKSSKDKLECFKNIAENVIELHKNGIFHLNIDPKFIIVEDMALCKFLLRMSHKNLKGEEVIHYRTNQSKYTAPENIPQITVATEQAEVYSLGMLFLVMMTSEEQVFNQINDDCYWVKFDQKCNKSLMNNLKNLLAKETKLKNLIMKAINFSSGARHKSMKEFYDELLLTGNRILL